MASMDHLYQPQYRPSFSADQQKIDDWLTGVDSLNTPDINPDFFNESNLFKTEKQSQNNLMAVSSLKSDALIDDYMYTANSDLTLSGAAISTSVNLDRSATYSPTYSDKQLDSQTININSPEMMPVSPNKVCPQMDQIYYDDSTVYPISLVEYDGTGFVDTSYTPSRSSSISTGSSDHHQLQSTTNSITTTTNSNTSNSSVATYLNEYLLSSHDLLTDSSVLTRLSPQSPASSQYSTDDKTFTNLDAVPSVNLHQLTATIKQEPLDQYQPTVVAEYETGQFGGAQAQYGTINTTDLTNYYQTLVQQQQQQSQYQSLTHAQVQQVANHTQPPTTTLHHNTTTTANSATNGRKRNSHAAFSAPSTSGTSTASGSKKPRMTKREKQKMMESDISKFENENHDLRNSIDLLERQIQFCKRFLSENVAPVIQRQQQQQQQQLHQFGSPQMVVVEAM